MATKSPKHLLVSSDGIAPLRWTETFADGMVCRNDSLPALKPRMVWLWLDIGADPEAVMAPVHRHFGLDVPIAVMTRIPSAAEAVRALQQGARAYLNAQAMPKVLLRVQDTVSSGAVWLGADLVEFLSSALQQLTPAAPHATHAPDWRTVLTQREIQVAERIGQGLSNKRVAREMSITERTVKAHLTSIFNKLDIKDRLMLALLVSGRVESSLESKVA